MKVWPSLMLAAGLAAASPALSASPPRSGQAPVTVVSEQPAPQPDTTRFVLKSQSLGRAFIVEVAGPWRIPAGADVPAELAAEHRIEAKVPAVYALDGGLDVTASAARLLGSNFAMQPAYVISISSAEPWGRRQWAERDRDFRHKTSVIDGQLTGGGGAAFEAFLLKELRPFIESRFPVDPGRTVLAGHSVGGLFAATVFSEHPDAFAGYLIASPSFWLDPALLPAIKALDKRTSGPRVFVSVGEKEETFMLDGARQLAATLSDKGFTAEFKALEGQPHVPSYLAALPWGLPFLLPPKSGSGGG